MTDKAVSLETALGQLVPLSDELGERKFVSIVYEIVDEKEWWRTNPLKYEHNGLKAITVSLGDLAQRCDLLEQICISIDIPYEIYFDL
jgi:hypothetical protein